MQTAKPVLAADESNNGERQRAGGALLERSVQTGVVSQPRRRAEGAVFRALLQSDCWPMLFTLARCVLRWTPAVGVFVKGDRLTPDAQTPEHLRRGSPDAYLSRDACGKGPERTSGDRDRDKSPQGHDPCDTSRLTPEPLGAGGRPKAPRGAAPDHLATRLV
ncbi:hypothetical protein SKAU_G00363720 [Synaphobranchus kaupii]|uniref:Uncharacterized protein n=1 Tax=Synaphobranchus kaupii TaxID=118154 RepID=A0A9Q1IHC5_SYNKA|nr:hypothetical protein SKAU_G00363720 [Synaphobranchus kaupii]